MKTINSEKAPAAIGPYSHAIQAGNFLFLSGQLGVNPATGVIEAEDIEGQTRQSFANVDAVLSKAGYTKYDVVKCTVFLSDMQNFKIVNELYAEYFETHKPARSAFAVVELPMKGMVEIEAIAWKE